MARNSLVEEFSLNQIMLEEGFPLWTSASGPPVSGIAMEFPASEGALSCLPQTISKPNSMRLILDARSYICNSIFQRDLPLGIIGSLNVYGSVHWGLLGVQRSEAVAIEIYSLCMCMRTRISVYLFAVISIIRRFVAARRVTVVCYLLRQGFSEMWDIG
ncbi:C6 transcription factor [Striga asiatica]|uniref:C6 transcription factor n=1 Tax=Striga asiatica TaxID=4170 RepID=A0A5A7QAQ6_STRAF|nr:C6 transcription factor [Striga asiatica]